MISFRDYKNIKRCISSTFNIWDKSVQWFPSYDRTNKQTDRQKEITKELSLCNKLWFSNPYIFSTQCSRPLIFQTMKYVRLNNPSLKYQRFTPTSSRDIGIGTFEFVAKTQILYYIWVFWKYKYPEGSV